MNIDAFMPHRGRMKLIEDLVEVDEEHCVARAVPRTEWPLCGPDGIGAVIIVELIAQTTSAYVGWKKRHEKELGGAGFLVGIRHAELLTDHLPLDVPVLISCTKALDMDTYGVFDGKVQTDALVYGTASIQVYNP
jgi:predicted hotdog family 3-hydroxylacyl-ACP dehydratase